MNTHFQKAIHAALIGVILTIHPIAAVAKGFEREGANTARTASKYIPPETQKGTCYWISAKGERYTTKLVMRGWCKKKVDTERGSPVFLPGEKDKPTMIAFYKKGIAQP